MNISEISRDPDTRAVSVDAQQGVFLVAPISAIRSGMAQIGVQNALIRNFASSVARLSKTMDYFASLFFDWIDHRTLSWQSPFVNKTRKQQNDAGPRFVLVSLFT